MASYYWYVHPGIGGLAFVDETKMEIRLRMYNPEKTGYTWGDFARDFPEKWESIVELSDPEDCPPPPIDDLFDIYSVPGFDEGDFPPWDASDAECPLPDEIIKEFGELRSSVLNGPYYFFAKEKLEEIEQRLREMDETLEEMPED